MAAQGRTTYLDDSKPYKLHGVALPGSSIQLIRAAAGLDAPAPKQLRDTPDRSCSSCCSQFFAATVTRTEALMIAALTLCLTQ